MRKSLIVLILLTVLFTGCESQQRYNETYRQLDGSSITWDSCLDILTKHTIKYIRLRSDGFTDEEAVAVINKAVGLSFSIGAVYEAFSNPDSIIYYEDNSCCLIYRNKECTTYIDIGDEKVRSINSLVKGEML